MNVVIVGCGTVGARLAKLLDQPNDEVSVVDIDQAAFDGLGSEFQGRCVKGEGFDEQVLIDAGVKECDAFAVVTGSDNVNLMVSEIALRLFSVPHVVTRIVNPDRIDLYQQLGLDYISDAELVAEGVCGKIRARKAHHMDTFGDYEVLTFSLNGREGLVRVRDLEALGEIDVSLVEHDGESFMATPNMFLRDGDNLLVVARQDDISALFPYMKG